MTTLMTSLRLLVLVALVAILALPATAFAQTKPGSAITIAQGELPSSLDPPRDWAIASTWIHMNLFDCLVWRDRETMEFVPWLATSWENVDDRTWRMNLREGVTFHNGEAFDADAVVWTFERIYTASRDQFITFNQWTFIEAINVLGPYQVEFVTKAPDPAFLSRISGTGCGIQAPVAGRAMTPEPYQPIGTGPYQLVSYVRDEALVMTANPNWHFGAPEIETVTWRSVPEASTRVASLMTGAADLISAVPFQDWERINANAGTKVTEYLTTQVMMLAMRTGPNKQYSDYSGPTEDPRIREAIKYALDRETIIDVINGLGVPTLTRITPPTLGSSPDMYGVFGEYDPERARSLLAEAGYAGEELTFHSSSSWINQRALSEVITAMLKDVGLNVNLILMDTPSFREKIYFPYRNEELYLDALGNSFFDPWIAVLSERGDRRERSAWSGMVALQADLLIRAAAQNMNAAERAVQYMEIARLIYDEAVFLPLYQMIDAVGTSERLVWSPPQDGFFWMGNAKLQ
ncbi:MAG: ABC transporter substrate-binding protein [bacterium]|nr:ABC transporter substrate-binding protein [bacterium]